MTESPDPEKGKDLFSLGVGGEVYGHFRHCFFNILRNILAPGQDADHQGRRSGRDGQPFTYLGI